MSEDSMFINIYFVRGKSRLLKVHNGKFLRRKKNTQVIRVQHGLGQFALYKPRTSNIMTFPQRMQKICMLSRI